MATADQLCPTCKGEGQVCDACGLAEDDCACARQFGWMLRDCPDCDGSGLVPAGPESDEERD